mgnify:FL=1
MENLANILLRVTVFEIVKWFFVVGLMMYIAFGIVVVRQVGIMIEAVEDEFNGVVFILAWAHLLLAMGLLVLAIVVL